MSDAANPSVQTSQERLDYPNTVMDAPSEPRFAGAQPPCVFSGGRRALCVLSVVALSVVTCLVGLRGGPAMGDHECLNALATREALHSEQWLVPPFNGAPHIRKTPLGIWLIGAASKILPHTGEPTVTAFSARLPSALAGIANALVVLWLGSMLLGFRAGVVAGLISASCAATVFYARNAQVDMVLTLFTSTSMALFWRGSQHEKPARWAMLAFYVALAGAMMAKAPLPLATVGLSLFAYWFVTIPLSACSAARSAEASSSIRRFIANAWDQVRALGRLHPIAGVFLFVILAGAWPAYVATHVDNAWSLWRSEYLDRFTGAMAASDDPFWYYLPILLGLMIPFMASLPEGVASPFLLRYADRRRGLGYAFTWAVVVTLFLSASSFKRPHYLLSAVPAYALLLAPVVDRLFFGPTPARRRRVQVMCTVIPVLLAIAAVVGGLVLRDRYPVLLTPFVWSAAVALLLWTAASWLFARGRRGASYVFFHLGVPILVVVMWPATGKIVFDVEGKALADSLRAHHIGTDADIYWADKRPDYSLEFYSDYDLRQLIDPNEMAVLRTHRASTPAAVIQEVEQRVRSLLRGADPVYVIMRSKHYRMLERKGGIETVSLFRLSGYRKDADDDLVVFTQAHTPSTRAASDALPARDES